MLSFLTSLISGICGFLNTVLPDSPFQGVIDAAQGMQTGLAWLNWFCPIGDLMLIFGGWLAVLLVWAAVDFALTKGEGVIGKVVSK